MTPNHAPAFEDVPTAGQIARWFIDTMRHESNVGGDAWWLSRNPHGWAYRVAHVDQDTQEFWLLEIGTEESRDMLWIMNGLDGEGVQWWQHPTTDADTEWLTDGLRWMVDQIEVHYDYQEARCAKR